jgi:hypothetical protein
MANIINDSIRAECESIMDDVFDTFARDIEFTMYKKPEETILFLESNFDANWDQKKPWADESSTFEEIKETFSVRMWFLDYEQQVKNLFFEGKLTEGAKAARNIQRIRIQTKQDGFEFIKQATKCQVFDSYWNISSSEKSIGLFGFKYYTFLLERAD